MKFFTRIILKAIGLKPEGRFGEGWTSGAVFRSLWSYMWAFTRGLWNRVWFRKASGIVLIAKGVRIIHASNLSTGRNFIAEEYCEINCLSQKGIHFGNKVTIGSYALIRPTGKYGGEIGMGLIVGDNSNIGPFSYIGCSGLITIGSNVMISPRVSIYAENHNFERTDIPMKDQGVTRKDVIIEDDCWIAANSVVLAGVTIGKGTIIAAGSVVTTDIPSYSIAAGVPARVIKKRNEHSDIAQYL